MFVANFIIFSSIFTFLITVNPVNDYYIDEPKIVCTSQFHFKRGNPEYCDSFNLFVLQHHVVMSN